MDTHSRSCRAPQGCRISAEGCPGIAAEFLGGRRAWYRQEYLCSFESVVDAVSSYEDIQAALRGDVKPLFGPATPT